MVTGFLQGAAVLPGPLEDIGVAFMGGTSDRPWAPRAVLFPDPLEHFKVAALGRAEERVTVRVAVPGAPVFPGPPEDLEVAHRPPVPRALVLFQPPEHFEVAAFGGVGARPPVPRAPVFPSPLEDLHTPFLGRDVAHKGHGRTPLDGPGQGGDAPSGREDLGELGARQAAETEGPVDLGGGRE